MMGAKSRLVLSDIPGVLLAISIASMVRLQMQKKKIEYT